jgi:four helix bundle protein
MATHKTLKAWVEAREVVCGVLRASRDHWRPWAAAPFDQLQRASLSVQLNIAEGWSFGPSPTRDRHLEIAFGSAREALEVIELMQDCQVLPAEMGAELWKHSDLTNKLLVGLLRRTRPRG